MICDSSPHQGQRRLGATNLGCFPTKLGNGSWKLSNGNYPKLVNEKGISLKDTVTPNKTLWGKSVPIYSVPCFLFHYKTLILLGVNIIPQNINCISSLASQCCLVDSHLIPSLPFSSLFSSSGGKFGFLLPKWAGCIGAWLSAMQRHPASFPELCLSSLLVSHCPSASFCQMLPHSGSDLRIFCLICIPQLLFDLSSALFSLLLLPLVLI